jgi:hypothetical protein
MRGRLFSAFRAVSAQQAVQACFARKGPRLNHAVQHQAQRITKDAGHLSGDFVKLSSPNGSNGAPCLNAVMDSVLRMAYAFCEENRRHPALREQI